jgi:hypothetical protein
VGAFFPNAQERNDAAVRRVGNPSEAHNLAAVNGENVAGHPGAVIAEQEEEGADEVLR